MGRAENRKQEKRLRKKGKMSARQLQEVKDEVRQDKLKDYLDKTWEKFSEQLIVVMRKHKISHERTSLIIKELYEELVRIYGEETND